MHFVSGSVKAKSCGSSGSGTPGVGIKYDGSCKGILCRLALQGLLNCELLSTPAEWIQNHGEPGRRSSQPMPSLVITVRAHGQKIDLSMVGNKNYHKAQANFIIY
jgi:hypothetical protein